jgi:hypothetical protein
LRNYYKKWLRYYLDFCQKYKQPISTKESLQQFIKKLQEKNQTPERQKQAQRLQSTLRLPGLKAVRNKGSVLEFMKFLPTAFLI